MSGGGERPAGRVRVAFVAGCLARGGAEKQLVYMARALRRHAVEVRVYALTRGDALEPVLLADDIAVTWIGRRSHPAARTLALIRELHAFRPHVVHASHFFTNLYAALAAPVCGAIGIGSLRNDVVHEVDANGRWGWWLLRLPRGLVANSEAARQNAVTRGVPAARVRVVPNVIELGETPAGADDRRAPERGPVVLALARLAAAKRIDLFLEAVARARREVPTLQGVIAGDGPERERLMQTATALGLGRDAVRFAGYQADVGPVLAGADMLLLTSAHEGFPNVVLEAQAARLPVVTTPAGDAGVVVEDGRTGFVVPHGAVDVMADRLVALARSAELRRRLGEAGRERVERAYSPDGLGDRLLDAYAALARHQGRPAIARLIEGAASAHAAGGGAGEGFSFPRGSR